jgi:hypothetical protein
MSQPGCHVHIGVMIDRSLTLYPFVKEESRCVGIPCRYLPPDQAQHLCKRFHEGQCGSLSFCTGQTLRDRRRSQLSHQKEKHTYTHSHTKRAPM